ncbi:MAG: glucosyltransferase domain-containing protein [Clostridia bacterium]|nr:glucosyltransferase domain-containing protein [Clostridia bacterium]
MLREKLGEIISQTDQKIAGVSLRNNRFSIIFQTAFWGTLICGLFAHGMALFNKYSWHDDIFSLFLTGTAIESGRWMLHVFSELEKWFFGNGHFSLPLFNGMLSLVCIGLSAGMMCVHFQIRSRFLSALLGGIMAVFPVIASLFGFMFTVHYYMIALFMLTVGCMLICTEKSWWKPLLGILLCGCALGVYQAFIPNLLMLMLLDVLMILCHREEKAGYYIRIILVRVVCIAGVMGVYFLGNQSFLWAKNLQLQDYLGISNMAKGSLSQYLAGAVRAYREFFRPSHFVLWDMYPQAVFRLYCIMLVLDILLGILLICQEWKKSPVRSLLMALCLTIVPLGCNFIFVMSEEVHSLMMYGQLMQMVLLICLIDWQERCWPSLLQLPRRGIALLLALSVFMYIRYDNQCYMKSAFQQQEAISWNTTLIARIESVEGFRDELPVAFINRENMRDNNLYNIEELDFLSLGTYDADIHGYLNDWAWQAFMARWCGFEPQMQDPSLVSAWPEVEQMPSYPDAGSIQVIRDVVVVKF